MQKEAFKKRYAFKENIGSGGFGQVYKAFDQEAERFVAIKRSEKAAHGFTLKREYELVNALPAQRNLLRFIDYACFEVDLGIEMEFLIMRYYEQGNLDAFWQRESLGAEEQVYFIKGLLQGIGFLHENAIIHRDLKPGNILVAREDGLFVPKIADFGLGKAGANIEKSSISNSSIGLTLAYAAPEQLTGDKIRPNIDLWAFGVLLYKLQTGELPFYSKATETTQKEAEIRRQITQGQLPEKLNGIAEPYQRMIRRCLVVDRKERVQDAEELLELLAGSGGMGGSGGGGEDSTVVIPEPTPELTPEPKPEPKPQPKGKESDKRRWLLLLLPLLGGLLWWNPFGGGTSEEAGILLDSVGQELGVDSTGMAEDKQGEESEEKPEPEPKRLPSAIAKLERNMVRVAGGTFKMGCTGEQSNCNNDEKPVHEVTVSSFNIGKYEVTQGQWLAVMGSNPSKFKGCLNCPVEQVSWNDVQQFIRKLNKLTGKRYRLPTEAEWEYAARGGNKSKGYKYSGSDSLSSVAWYSFLMDPYNDKLGPHEVGGKRDNELGLYDMSGNVWERCEDWYGKDYYGKSARSNPIGPSSGKYRLMRGGAFNSGLDGCGVSRRSHSSLDSRRSYIGFRLVRP